MGLRKAKKKAPRCFVALSGASLYKGKVNSACGEVKRGSLGTCGLVRSLVFLEPAHHGAHLVAGHLQLMLGLKTACLLYTSRCV